MSDATHGTPDSSFSDSGRATAGKTPLALRGVLYCSLAAAVAVVGYVGYRAMEAQAAMRAGQDRLVAQHGLAPPGQKRLAPEYADKDGGLLADPPSEADKLLVPEKLVFAYYEGDDDDEEPVDWEAFRAHLQAGTGKEVVGQPYLNTADEVAAIKKGQIHVITLHAADTPYIVNNAGFVPFAVVGSASGASGNHLAIAVRPDSAIKKLSDLRGRKLTCTRPDSITGYRAAIAILSQDAGLRPGVDYGIHFSLGQKRSIRGLVDGEFDVVALPHDKLEDMLADSEIEKDDVRLVYESQVIPRRTIGHVFNLEPELAGRVREAVLSFRKPAADGQAEDADAMRFVPIDYKQDFAFARKIDDAFDPRFGQPSSTNPTP
jgi:phosphonate transport system substrate-binding protein